MRGGSMRIILIILMEVKTVPLYEYHCDNNGKTVFVRHGMTQTLRNWGEVCRLSGYEIGTTSAEAPVRSLLGGGMILVGKRSTGGNSSSCCGESGCSREHVRDSS